MAARRRSAITAKEMWRDMHLRNMIPKPEALRYMLEAASQDATAKPPQCHGSTATLLLAVAGGAWPR